MRLPGLRCWADTKDGGRPWPGLVWLYVLSCALHGMVSGLCLCNAQSMQSRASGRLDAGQLSAQRPAGRPPRPLLSGRPPFPLLLLHWALQRKVRERPRSPRSYARASRRHSAPKAHRSRGGVGSDGMAQCAGAGGIIVLGWCGKKECKARRSDQS